MGKNSDLLVWGERGIVIERDRGLLRQQSIGHHGIAVIQAVDILVELSKSAADYGLLQRLPGESEARRDAPVLVGKLAGQRKRRILAGLRIHLEIFAQS